MGAHSRCARRLFPAAISSCSASEARVVAAHIVSRPFVIGFRPVPFTLAPQAHFAGRVALINVTILAGFAGKVAFHPLADRMCRAADLRPVIAGHGRIADGNLILHAHQNAPSSLPQFTSRSAASGSMPASFACASPWISVAIARARPDTS